jgi:hypothetical protein
MPLHLIKLCVGVDTIRELEDWIAEKRRRTGRSGNEHVHVTRMMPKRHEALTDGGSLYWVIRGQLACRQRLTALRPITDDSGVSRCELVLDPAVVPVAPRSCGPFQGWRYLDAKDAPCDLAGEEAAALGIMPEALRRELVDLGLL